MTAAGSDHAAGRLHGAENTVSGGAAEACQVDSGTKGSRRNQDP